ncbi:MAG: efflux RND transporter permease subunit [Spirochaetales bacterium]|nr:efflux RND transporter permease subunit [Spirochaetales bacterium]
MIKFLVNKFVPVLCFALLIVIIGVNAYNTIPREAQPEIKVPWIMVNTSYGGVAAKDIESLITSKIESELDGLDGLESITSSTYQSYSSIWLEFSADTTVEEALRLTKDRVDSVKGSLPEDANDPYVKEVTMSDWAPVLTIVLSHPKGVAILDSYATKLQQELNSVGGVLDTTMSGDQTWELAVELDPIKLEHYDFTIDDVRYAIMGEHTTIPGGILKNSKKNFSLSVTGEIKDPMLFGEIIVSSGGKKVKLKNLGEVSFKPAEAQSYARINKNSAITLEVKKKVGTNVVELIDNAKKVINSLEKDLPEGSKLIITHDSSKIIDSMIADLENNMFTSIILVLLVTFLFLGKTNSIFVSIAIPFSMLISFFVLQLMGLTLNMMVLFSLILALGMLVDNGIVIVENIFRHGAMGKNRKQAAIDGTSEVAGPIIASTLTTCLVFFPILFMPGMMGEFMSFIPKTVIVVLLASLAVGLTITPVFCSKFLRISDTSLKKMVEGGGFFGTIQSWYFRLLNFAIHRSKRFILLSISVCILGAVAYVVRDIDPTFFPAEDPGQVRVTVEAPRGSSIDETDKFIKRVEDIVSTSPASLSSFTSNTNSGGNGSITVNYADFNEREISGEEAQIALAENLKNVTGAKVVVQSDTGMGGNDISYRVVGEEYSVLGEISQEIIRKIKNYNEVKIIDTDFESSEPEYLIEVNRDKAAYYGFNTQQIASTIRNAINGSNVGKYRVGDDEYDINVRYMNSSRKSLQDLERLQLTIDGKRITLGSIATITQGTTIGVIKREDLQRTVNVYGSLKKGLKNNQEVLQSISKDIEEIKKELPEGYDIILGADGEMQNEATGFLVQAFIIAGFLIFILLIGQFNSLLDPVIAFTASLLAIGGVFWGFAIFSMSFGIIMSGIGCISLIGVAVNNCIVLVDYTNLLIKDGMDWRIAIPEAGKTRLKPVILTALTTVLALIPMGIGISFDLGSLGIQWDSENAAMWKPFAWAMMFGLTFSTFLTLIIVPVMLSAKHSALEKFRIRKEQRVIDSTEVAVLEGA